MKIEELKINGFGNLENKELELKDGINIIKGKNESGKSTLLKFIGAMLYGANRNKNGKNISDFEKYKPWKAKEYSGKLKYILDNNEKFEVFRDFSKKTPKIYNEKLEEITNNYSMDKSKNSLFFAEQTGINEEILFKTAITEQAEVDLNKTDQHMILQKISNTVSTGSEKISFSKAMDKLKQKFNEEVGTERTAEKPLNIVNRKKLEIENELACININKDNFRNFQAEKDQLNQTINKEENYLKLLKEYKELNERLIVEEEKLKVREEQIEKEKKALNEIEGKEKKITKNDIEKTSNKGLIIGVIVLIVTVLQQVVIQNIAITMAGVIILLIIIGMQSKKIMDVKNKEKVELEERNLLKKEKELLQDNINNKNNELENIIKELKEIIKLEKEQLKNKYKNIILENKIMEILELTKEQITTEIEFVEQKIKRHHIEKVTKEINYKEISKQTEKIIDLEEELEKLKEEEQEILEVAESINIAKETLEEAYEEMKENITPEFTNNISKNIDKISNGRYINIKFNDEQGLIVELENGEYVNVEMLSIGTIDQMYISLRLAALNEISKEKMPLILDEAFAYYDKSRLKNILGYLNEEFNEYQIIIFTCNDREIEMLEDLKIKYNLVEM